MPVLSVLARNWVMRVIAAILTVIIAVVLFDALRHDEGESAITIEMHDFYFTPDDFFTASSADSIRVRVVNRGSVAHTFTTTPPTSGLAPPVPDAERFDRKLQPGEEFSFDFEPDRLRYHCRFHEDEGMRGEIVNAGEY